MEINVVKELREYYVALSDATRLRILELLARRELTVTEIARGLRMSQPLVSWHLRRLVRTGLIQMHRDGREVRCSLDRARMHEYERQFDSLIASQ
ncbi:MAG: metalloregulator ArsR/SmtB family transcription factor [Chloroflexi bacterium]|nr:metalloregulator ArsR/SmtB family transcription factor [Chloroflexota bacterium]